MVWACVGEFDLPDSISRFKHCGWSAGRALVLMSSLIFTSAAFGADGWQWRINKADDGRLLLAYSEFEATDDMSGLRFYCKSSSGRVQVVHDTDKEARQVLADLIRSDDYPKVELEDETSTPGLSHSDIDGWEYHFEIAADGAAFNSFKKTGQLSYKIGAMVVKNEPMTGFNTISEFQAACRKPR